MDTVSENKRKGNINNKKNIQLMLSPIPNSYPTTTRLHNQTNQDPPKRTEIKNFSVPSETHRNLRSYYYWGFQFSQIPCKTSRHPNPTSRNDIPKKHLENKDMIEQMMRKLEEMKERKIVITMNSNRWSDRIWFVADFQRNLGFCSG